MGVDQLEFFYSRFHSRFAPGFTPDSRSNLITLHHTRSGRFPHSFNVNITHGLTPSHSIPNPTDRPFKARVLGSSPSRLTTIFNVLAIGDHAYSSKMFVFCTCFHPTCSKAVRLDFADSVDI
jgi:hypothetical protein